MMKAIFKTLALILLLGAVSVLNGQVGVLHPSNGDYVDGKIRLKLKREAFQQSSAVKSASTANQMDQTGFDGIDELNRQVGVTRISRVFPFSLKDEPLHREYGFHLWLEFDFAPEKDPAAIAELYRVLDEVDIAKPVYRKVQIDRADEPVVLGSLESAGQRYSSNHVHTARKSTTEVSFNDPLLPEQWHYHNDGRIGTEGTDIDMLKAWTRSTGSKDVIVAIVDGGIDVDHEDLKDNMWINEAELNGEDGVDDDQNGYVDDIHGFNFVFGGPVTSHFHGTHVAGTVGAVNNNGIGVAGVAGGDGSGNGVKLMSCQIYDNRASGGGNFAAAIVYGADHGAVISQNSWGYTTPGYYEPEVYEAIQYFIAEAGRHEGSPMKGGVLFFAAGNSGREESHYPGTFEEVIAVASSGPSGYPAPYSTHGTWVDILAPGGDQKNYATEGGVLSTFPNDDYGYYQGTSMACPHVSGVAALVVSRFGGDHFTAKDLEQVILHSTDPLTFEHQDLYGLGMLNANNALAEDERIPPDVITDLSASDITHKSLRLEWTVPADEDNFQPALFHLVMSDTEITEENFDQQIIFELNNPYEAGSRVMIPVEGFSKKTSYWFAVKSADQYGNLSGISNILKVTTTDEPHFMESTREVELDIDVNQGAVHTVALSFSNIGEGIVYWNSFTVNENPYWIEQEEWGKELDEAAASAASQIDLYNATRPLSMPVNDQAESLVTDPDSEYWRNDQIWFVDALAYTTGAPVSSLGSGTPNAGLILATRYHIPEDYVFNLTHIEVPMYLESKERPVMVEIRKGSREIEGTDRVYLQEYYPDTVGTGMFYRIPLFQPSRFEDDEYLWVVLHFPKEESYPTFLEHPYSNFDFTGYFMVSSDNGASYYNAYEIASGRVVSMVRALSSGIDGSYVFIDPVNGEIAAGQSEEITLTVDAGHLSNGKHLAGVGIVTSDEYKPGINIEVKVNVRGQVPGAEVEDLFEYEIYTQVENALSMKVKNTGLADLKIHGMTSSDTGFSMDLEDTLVIQPALTAELPFAYTTSVDGEFPSSFRLLSNIGDIVVNTRMLARQAPGMELSLSEDTITLAYDQRTSVELTIRNNGSGTELEYDMEDHDRLKVADGTMPRPMSYSILNSADHPDQVAAGQWEDISTYGKAYGFAYFWDKRFDLQMDFPYFAQAYQHMWGLQNAQLYFYSYGPFGSDSLKAGNAYAKAYMAALNTEGFPLMLDTMHHYSFGDREVFSFQLNLERYEDFGFDKEDKLQLQMVLFREGAIEFRYRNLEKFLSTGVDYSIGIQGLEPENYYLFRDAGRDSTNALQEGMVIRFEPEQDVNFISTSEPAKGILTQGDEVSISLDIDPSLNGIHPGNYRNDVVVRGNTAEEVHSLPLWVTVTGGGKNYEALDSLDFGPVHTGAEQLRHVSVRNTGIAGGEIRELSFDHPAFSSEVTTPISLNGQSEVVLPVHFRPTAAESVSEAVLTIDFDNGQRETVVLQAIAERDPEFTLTHAPEIHLDLAGGESAVLPLSLSNMDLGVELEYSFMNTSIAKVKYADTPNGSVRNSDIPGDDYGYTWLIGDDTRSTYKWNDISMDPSTEVLYAEHERQQRVILPFSFPYYGQLFDTIWVSKNGYITVIEPEGEEFNLEFTPGDGVAGIIAPFYSFLDPPSVTDGVLCKTDEDRVYIQWEGFKGADQGSAAEITFQLELTKDGSIYFHYQYLGEWPGVLNYGLESPDESETFETEKTWILRWSELGDRMTIAIAPPHQDRISSGESRELDLEISAERIYRSGLYRDTIDLLSNSHAQLLQRIPVSLNVTGEPLMEYPDTLHWEEAIFGSHTPLEQEITFINKGYEVGRIDRFTQEGLDGLELFYQSGIKVVMNSSGYLPKPLQIEPWESLTLVVRIPVNEQEDVAGRIHLHGNFGPAAIEIAAEIVDSPVFSWNAIDQDLELLNSETHSYTFSLENQGETSMDFELLPVVTPKVEESPEEPGIKSDSSNIVDAIGTFSFSSPNTVDSMALDTKEEPDGIWTPMIWGSPLAFCNQYIAGEGGFFLTHVKAYIRLRNLEEFVRLTINVGGAEPDTKGKLAYQQDYVIDRYVNGDWIYFELQNPVSIPEGDTFYVTIKPPFIMSGGYTGYETQSDPNINKYSWTGNYQGFREKYFWGPEPMDLVHKIRPLTAAGKGLWIELDQLSGNLEGGESLDVTATVNARLAGVGENQAQVLVRSTDANRPKDQFKLDILVNGDPELKYRPNHYEDTVKVMETEELVLNYLFTDPEGEAITWEVVENDQLLDAEFTQTGSNTAQVRIRTDYESAGVYSYELKMSDASGNEIRDELWVEVLDRNRAPVLNPEYGLLQLNLSGTHPVLSIPSDELFSDPDGDAPAVMAGNYTPEVVDLALGYNYIDVHPLAEGTGFLVFGADDGKQDGFVVYGVYALVIDDPDAAKDGLDGYGDHEEPFVLLEAGETLGVYPNPVSNDTPSSIIFLLKEDADARLMLTDMQGRTHLSEDLGMLQEGLHMRTLDGSGLAPGLYFCSLIIEGSVKETLKVLVK